jgi:carbon catabolite-derepressing protein kinase
MHEDQEVSKESQIKEASPVVVVEPDNQMLIDAEESKVESPQPPASILLSTRFQDFILLDESNWRETGVAIVKAIETATKRPVVLKLMSKSFAQPGSTIRLNTCREIVIQKQIHHRHAMALIDVMESDLFLCLLMEFAEHKDLFYVLESRGALPAQMALRILIETAEVLHYCHQRGIYHRDIKPDNIFMNQNFQVLLGDWNLAHCMTPNSKTRTQTGTLIYMPPEMFQPAIPYDPAKAEAWSLGVVLYIMLYGYPPWEVRTRLVAPGQTERFVPNYDEQLDPALRVLLQRLLCKNAEERMSIEFLLQIDWIRDVIRGKTTLVSLS